LFQINKRRFVCIVFCLALFGSTRWILFDNLKRFKVSVKTGATVTSIRNADVKFKKDDKEHQVQFDNIILASGSKSVPGLSTKVKKMGYPFFI
jgi:predicted flavoprotein YhiN